MTAKIKVMWFLFCSIFINCFGFVDAELFVVINFLIGFSMLYNILSPHFKFLRKIFYIRVVMLNFRRVLALLASFFMVMFESSKTMTTSVFEGLSVAEFVLKDDECLDLVMVNSLLMSLWEEFTLMWGYYMKDGDKFCMYTQTYLSEMKVK